MADAPPKIREAYAECRRLARRHSENFPVASRLVSRDKRDALAAIYAFARIADDWADEPDVRDRLGSLAAWRSKLGDCFAGRADHPVFVALGHSARKFQLSRINFENLLRAFEMDVEVACHRDFDSLLRYSEWSANPVGRLVLELYGHREPELVKLSDRVCTALQLANFWQDVALDLDRKRVYLPLEDLDRFDYSLRDLEARRVDGRWRSLMGFEVERTRAIFNEGRLLSEKVVRSLRRQLRLTWLGGMAILNKIEAVGYDVFRRRPALGRRDFFLLYLKARRGRYLGNPDPPERRVVPSAL